MNDTEKHISESIKTWVWSGFYSPDEVTEMIDDIVEDDADQAVLRATVPVEFERKRQAERTWPRETDCDRLDAAFEKLDEIGIAALHNAGYTIADGRSDVAEYIAEDDPADYGGYCFYHAQDLERAVNGQGLWLAFGESSDSDDEKAIEAAKRIVEVLTEYGFQVEWAGNVDARIFIPKFDWKRRGEG